METRGQGRFQLLGTLVVASLVVAFFLTRRVTLQFFVVFVLACGALGGVYMWLLKKLSEWRDRRSAPFRDELTRIQSRVASLNLDDAKRQVETLLTDPRYYRSRTSPPTPHDAPALAVVGPAARLFFETYESVEEVRGDIRLDRADIGASKFNPAFIRLGRSTDSTEVVARRNDDTVYEIDGSEVSGAEQPGYRSIYHWLLVMWDLVRL